MEQAALPSASQGGRTSSLALRRMFPLIQSPPSHCEPCALSKSHRQPFLDLLKPFRHQEVLNSRTNEDELCLDESEHEISLTASEPDKSTDIHDDNHEVANHPVPRAKPGWDNIVMSDKAPKDISSKIDESNNILHSKRRAHLAIALHTSEIPRTYREAMLSSDASCWSQVIDKELQAMNDLCVWEIEPVVFALIPHSPPASRDKCNSEQAITAD
ncbi:uncharacterized protein VP01_773g1 [Puccinia sorghi]|uniref:Uncharacterized protein n=1 Tax=Puccinia sorghi TaxID=27349 RepID=A0A0L6UDI8_9BASI|nr:uncharacterized protein VP01_773g1 [Puccinia sorghi]